MTAQGAVCSMNRRPAERLDSVANASHFVVPERQTMMDSHER